MKKLKLFLVFLITTCSVVFAQNAVKEIQPIELIKEVGLQNIGPNLNINPIQVGNIPNHSNSVFIDQIGSNNTINVKSATDTSTLELVQEGNNNVMRLNFSALSAKETIYQIGDNHNVAAYGKSPSINLERTVKQTGYGQNLTIHGSNSLSEKMQLKMKGAASTIVIRNFN